MSETTITSIDVCANCGWLKGDHCGQIRHCPTVSGVDRSFRAATITESHSPIAGKADEVPETVRFAVALSRSPAHMRYLRSCGNDEEELVIRWLADDRERLLARVEELSGELDEARQQRDAALCALDDVARES